MSSSSIVQKLATRAADPAWVEKAVARGRVEVDSFHPAARPLATAGLDYLQEHRKDAAGISGDLTLAIATRFQNGQVDAARREWLTYRATADERADALDLAIGNVIARVASDAAAWAAVVKFVTGFLEVAGPIALSLLLAIL